MEDSRVGRRMEAKVNGWANSAQFAVRLRSDVMERSAGDERLSALEERS